jgi:hypothetical protein
MSAVQRLLRGNPSNPQERGAQFGKVILSRTGFLKLWYAHHQWYTGLVRKSEDTKINNPLIIAVTEKVSLSCF